MAEELTFSPYAREVSTRRKRFHRLLIMPPTSALIDICSSGCPATYTKAKRHYFANVAVSTANQLSCIAAAWSRRHASANNSALNVEKRKGSAKCDRDDWHVIAAGFSGDAVSCKSAPREGGLTLITLPETKRKGPRSLRTEGLAA